MADERVSDERLEELFPGLAIRAMRMYAEIVIRKRPRRNYTNANGVLALLDAISRYVARAEST